MPKLAYGRFFVKRNGLTFDAIKGNPLNFFYSFTLKKDFLVFPGHFFARNFVKDPIPEDVNIKNPRSFESFWTKMNYFEQFWLILAKNGDIFF